MSTVPPQEATNYNANALADTHVERARSSRRPENTSNEGVNSDTRSDDWSHRVAGVVAQFIGAFVELIADFGAPIPVQDSFAYNATVFLTCSDEILYWGRAKNLVCFFKALYLRCSPPDVTGYHFVGSWKRWAKSRMHFNRRNTSLWASTFKVKNAAARLSERAAVVTMHKHRMTVSNEATGSLEHIRLTVHSIMPVLIGASRFIAADYARRSWMTPVAASNSASYETSRGEFGQVGELIDLVFGPGCYMACPDLGFTGLGPQKYLEGTDDYEDRLVALDKTEDPCRKTTEFYESITLDGITYEHSWFSTYYFPTTEDYWMNDIWIKALQCMDKDRAMAKVCAVLEPFKVRIITKGEASLQYLSGHFQKALHAYNAMQPCFQLVGQRPSADLLVDLMNSSGYDDDRSALFECPEIVAASSDFSGASDKTRAYYRDQLMQVLTSGLPLDWQALIEMCNGEHEVIYPGPKLYPSMKELGEVPPCIQRDGTLMGERTSFGILCLEVLGAHVKNLRDCGDTRPLESVLKGVLINGDDRLAFSSAEVERRFWEYCSAHLGFTESVGKSYVHTKYANINSQSYIFDFPKKSAWKVPVRATGLEHGVKKLDEPFNPCAVITEVLNGCFDSRMQWTVLQRYMKRHAFQIKRYSGGRNLFLPVCFGGCGSRTPDLHPRERCRRTDGSLCGHRTGQEWNIGLTNEQLDVATCIIASSGKALRTIGPQLPTSYDLPEILETPWNVYGKPTYWDGPKFEDCQSKAEFEEHRELLRTVDDRYRRELLRVTGGQRFSARQLLGSRLLCPTDTVPQSYLRETRRSVWKCINTSCNRTNDGSEIDCACGGTRYGYICGVCYEYNPETGKECSLCGIIEYPDQIVKPQTWPIISEHVACNPTHCDLSLNKIKSLGYIAPSLDEFDVQLYKHAIECARFEHYELATSQYDIPVVRFCGRAVDLFGEKPGWAALRPARLTWSV